MAVAYVSLGAAAVGSGGASVSPTVTNSTAGRYAVLQVFTSNQPISTPSPWTLLAQTGTWTPDSAGSMCLQIFGRETEASAPTVTLTAPSGVLLARISLYSGVDTTNPIDTGPTYNSTTTSTTHSFATISPKSSRTSGLVLLLACGNRDAESTALFGIPTIANLYSTPIRRYNYNSSVATGGGILLATSTAKLPSDDGYDGTIGTPTFTYDGSNTRSCLEISLALKAPLPTFSSSPGSATSFSSSYREEVSGVPFSISSGSIVALSSLAKAYSDFAISSGSSVGFYPLAPSFYSSAGSASAFSSFFKTRSDFSASSGSSVAFASLAKAYVEFAFYPGSAAAILSAAKAYSDFSASSGSSVAFLKLSPSFSIASGAIVELSSAAKAYSGFSLSPGSQLNLIPIINSEFAPCKIFPAAYAFDGVNITIKRDLLSALSEEEVHAASGDLRKLVQALLLRLDSHLAAMSPIDQPQTIKSFMLEDWNRKNATFGRHTKRSFTIQFITTSPPANVAEPE